MEGDLNYLQRKGGQLPRVSLMVVLWINGRRRVSTTVMSAPWISIPLSPGLHYFTSELRHLARSENWVIAQWVLLAVIQWILRPPGSAMPRERGKPRRGPAWYSYAARQRRLQNLEWALSIARTQRTARPHTPPMAYVEEEFPEEPIQVPPESLLYTVPTITCTPTPAKLIQVLRLPWKAPHALFRRNSQRNSSTRLQALTSRVAPVKRMQELWRTRMEPPTLCRRISPSRRLHR
jgi:hypothetical protein